MTISIKSGKAKGRKFQQYIAEKVSQLLDIPWGKDELISSRAGGQSGTDLVLLGKAAKLFRFSVECKSTEKWDVHGAIKQAKANRKKGTDWLLFMKRSRESPVVIMDVDTFFSMQKDLLSLRNEENYLRKEISDLLNKME